MKRRSDERKKGYQKTKRIGESQKERKTKECKETEIGS